MAKKVTFAFNLRVYKFKFPSIFSILNDKRKLPATEKKKKNIVKSITQCALRLYDVLIEKDDGDIIDFMTHVRATNDIILSASKTHTHTL